MTPRIWGGETKGVQRLTERGKKGTYSKQQDGGCNRGDVKGGRSGTGKTETSGLQVKKTRGAELRGEGSCLFGCDTRRREQEVKETGLFFTFGGEKTLGERGRKGVRAGRSARFQRRAGFGSNRSEPSRKSWG